MEWKEIKEGKDICPRCKFGILEFETSADSIEHAYTCDRCKARFKPKDYNED